MSPNAIDIRWVKEKKDHAGYLWTKPGIIWRNIQLPVHQQWSVSFLASHMRGCNSNIPDRENAQSMCYPSCSKEKKKSLRNAFMSNSFPMNLSGWISCTTAPRGVGELACGRWWLAAKQGILEDTCQKEYLSRIEWLSQVWWCKAVTLVLEAEAEGRQCSRPAWGAYWEFVSSGVLILNDSFFIKCGGGMPKCLLPIPLSLISSQ